MLGPFAGISFTSNNDLDEGRLLENYGRLRPAHSIFLFRASTGIQVLPAFSSGRHDWSMGAQWLVVIDRAAAVDTDLGALVKQLFEDSFPQRWPGALRVIIQAAVDGDGAACHCRDPAVRDELIDAMQRSAGAYGAQLRVNMASPGQPQA